MAQVRKKDVVLWLKHVIGDEALRRELAALDQYERVQLIVGGVPGTYEKMRNAGGCVDGKRTPGLRPADAASKQIWADITDGTLVTLERGEAGDPEVPVAAEPSQRPLIVAQVHQQVATPAPRARARPTAAASADSRPLAVASWTPVAPGTLAIGCDLAWWGGSAKNLLSKK